MAKKSHGPGGAPSAPSPLLVQRTALLSSDQLGRIEEAMTRILEEIGIAVKDEFLLKRLSSRGFRIQDGRVRLQRSVVAEFLATERKNSGHKFSEHPQVI